MGLRGSNGALNVGSTLKFPQLTEIENQLTQQLGSKVTIRIFSQEGFKNIIKTAGAYKTN